MAGLLITLPIAAIIALAFLAFFLWSVKNEDYEDSEMIKYRMLMDEQDQADRSIVAGDSGRKGSGAKTPDIHADANVTAKGVQSESISAESEKTVAGS